MHTADPTLPHNNRSPPIALAACPLASGVATKNAIVAPAHAATQVNQTIYDFCRQ
jgi:hypothetical protein